MDNSRGQAELTALMIAPDREMAQQFAGTIPATRAFQILGELKAYPPAQTLEIRLRQLRPDLVFVDLATDLNKAAEVIEFITAQRLQVFVVGLNRKNDPEAILRSLRAGAAEYLYAPFDLEMQREAIARLARMRTPQSRQEAGRGRLIAFSSTKPGSGASTLAAQAAFALRKSSGKRVLLADFDMWGGTVGFFFKVNHWYSLVDALGQMEKGEEVDWPALVVSSEGVDILPAPDTPQAVVVEPNRLHNLLEYMRGLYDFVVIDLPNVFEKMSLVTLSDSDEAFLVSTAELPSLHLTRKAVAYLGNIGFGQERYKVVVNRVGKQQEGIKAEDMSKIFGTPLYRTFPNDHLSLHKGLTAGQPLSPRSPLGKTIEEFTGQLSARAAAEAKREALVN
jgi:pilus assembly protein CpaE